MTPRSMTMTLCAALILTGAAAGVSGAAGPPQGTPEQQTHPRVVPRRGRRHTAFAVKFTLADTPGHEGVVATSYDIGVQAPKRARAACTPPPPPPVDQGQQGTVARVRLPRPVHGWCVGRYTVTVFLQRGPYCPPPPPTKPPTPCPEFATQQLAVGRAHFVVRRARAHR